MRVGVVQGTSAAAELPDELFQAVDALRSLSDKAAKAARKADAPELAAKHRAFAGKPFLDRSPPCRGWCESRSHPGLSNPIPLPQSYFKSKSRVMTVVLNLQLVSWSSATA